MSEKKPVTHTESEDKSTIQIHRTESGKKATFKVQQTIKFRIEEFEALMKSCKPGEGYLWSEGVSSELVPRAVWKLRVYPNGYEEELPEFSDWLNDILDEEFDLLEVKSNIGVSLHLTGPMAHSKENLDATYHLYLINGSNGKTDSIGHYTHNFGKKHYGWGWDVSHARAKKALHADGSLLVAADVDFFPPDDGGAKVIYEASALRGYEDREQWATKFSELHGDQASSDCSIEIGGMSIPAHKCILAAHSPIFRSMFSHQEADEFQSGTIKITDIQEPEPMRALVRYCYQGQLDAATMDGEGAVEIFKLADRYCIAGLKALLERHFIEKRLSEENVVAMAVLADTYTAPTLKEACHKLIARVGDPIFESADWNELMEARPKLAAQLAVETIRILNKK